VGTVSIFNQAMTRHAFSLNRPDVLIRPAVGDIWTLDFRHADRLVALGRSAVDEWFRANGTIGVGAPNRQR
jgi:predicted acylesterase/phospholipase RssA